MNRYPCKRLGHDDEIAAFRTGLLLLIANRAAFAETNLLVNGDFARPIRVTCPGPGSRRLVPPV